ncbi:MAG: hypothetical protein EA401_07185 [Planctomycetota bacterium]|nr:MAG: hypothetical protein EA401_07185 [Planctomycetota bacterium]
MNAEAHQDIASWSGELLWPQDLPDAPIIDCSQVSAVGSWLHHWLRQRGQRSIVGASPAVRRQLSAARLPLLWYATLQQVPSADAGAARPHGVSSGERALLLDQWSEEDSHG